MIKVVGYVRVSTDEQRYEGFSLIAQRGILEKHAAEKALELVEIVADEGVSASTPLAERKGGARLAQLVNTGQVSAVLTWKLDRLFRLTTDGLTTVKQWAEQDVACMALDFPQISIFNERGELDPHAKFMLTVRLGAAEWERDMTIVRTRGIVEYRRAAGLAVGPTPYGWDKAPDNSLFPNEKEQKVLLMIGLLLGQGQGLRTICRALNEAGITSKRGGQWTAQAVKNIADRWKAAQAKAGD